MIRIAAWSICALALAGAVPAFAQQAPTGVGIGSGQVNRAIPGTPGTPGTVVNPTTGLPGTPRPTPTPLYRNGLATLRTPAVNRANRANGVVGQAGVNPVRGVNGVRQVGAAPLNQRPGATRPVLVWQP